MDKGPHARNVLVLTVLAAVVLVRPSSAAPPVAACLPSAPSAAAIADACTLVQPGGRVLNEGNKEPCTLNFMFRGSDHARYIAGAGHCFRNVDVAAPQTWRRGHGPVAHDTTGRRIGEYAFWTVHYQYGTADVPLIRARDLALIRLDKGVASSPALAHFGGPTGMNNDITTSPVLMHSVGNGEGLGYVKETGTPVAPARTFLATSMTNPNAVGVAGYSGPGDSGSPVISDDGRAVALLVGLAHVGQSVTEGSPDLGALQLIRLPQMIALAQRTMHLRLTLMTAPLA